MRYSMIMAGGAGTRLWPMSRQRQPKQLIPFIGNQSLLEVAFERLDGLVPIERRLVCTSERHRKVICDRIPQIADANILGEPAPRNTLNAVGFAAAVLHKQDPDAIFAVLTSDHIIEPRDEFQKKLDVGFQLVEQDPSRFITFSIKADYPATGYGYVQPGAAISGFESAYLAESFHEKPELPEAKEFIAAGYNWNSGMFVFHAGRFMDAMKQFGHPAADDLTAIADAWGTDAQQQVLDRLYPTLKPSISVDYGVMEPAAKSDDFTICTIIMDVAWTDIGSWPAYAGTLGKGDAHGSRSNCQTIHRDSSNILAVSDDPDHVIATVGCKDLIVIQVDGITLVCPADRAEDIGKLVSEHVPESLK